LKLVESDIVVVVVVGGGGGIITVFLIFMLGIDHYINHYSANVENRVSS
jgi:hypothetical protein